MERVNSEQWRPEGAINIDDVLLNSVKSVRRIMSGTGVCMDDNTAEDIESQTQSLQRIGVVTGTPTSSGIEIAATEPLRESGVMPDNEAVAAVRYQYPDDETDREPESRSESKTTHNGASDSPPVVPTVGGEPMLIGHVFYEGIDGRSDERVRAVVASPDGSYRLRIPYEAVAQLGIEATPESDTTPKITVWAGEGVIGFQQFEGYSNSR